MLKPKTLLLLLTAVLLPHTAAADNEQPQPQENWQQIVRHSPYWVSRGVYDNLITIRRWVLAGESYCEVKQRHIDALDEPALRAVAEQIRGDAKAVTPVRFVGWVDLDQWTILLRPYAPFALFELGDAAGIGIGRVEHHYAMLLCGFQIHLIGADTETTDGDEFRRIGEHFGRKLGSRANADKMGVFDAVDEFIFRQRSFQIINIGIASGIEAGDSGGVHTFQQYKLDLVFIQGDFRSHGEIFAVMESAPDQRGAGAPSQKGRRY